jgi:hypothetical protein
MGDPLDTLGFAEATLAGASGPVSWCELSVDPLTHEGAALARLPDGWSFSSEGLDHYLEIFTVDGTVWHGEAGSACPGAMTYHFFAPGEPIGPLVALGDSLAYINFGGKLHHAG